jgi:hypothetical protein
MKRPLWTQKLSDEKLRIYIKKVEFLEEIGTIEDKEILSLADTWYDTCMKTEQLMRLSIDLWKEAAFRWERESGR